MIASASREDLLRHQVSEELGERVTDEMWAYLKTEGRVHAALTDPNVSASDLAGRIRRVYIAAEKPLPPPNAPRMITEESKARRGARSQPSARDRRLLAIAELLAEDARQNDAVQAFRQSILAGRLLPWGEVEPWVKRQAAEDGEPTPGPKGGFLEYGVPDDRWRRLQPVRVEGVLGTLRALATSLASQYRWQEGQATLFILTDAIPYVAPLQVGMDWHLPFEAMSRHTARSALGSSGRAIVRSVRNTSRSPCSLPGGQPVHLGARRCCRGTERTRSGHTRRRPTSRGTARRH
jgi:hypothetical protein